MTKPEKDDTIVGSEEHPTSSWDPSQFPDGGYKAWTVVLGAFCCVFCSFGWLNCIGIFQAFYQSHQLQEYHPSEISWIASMEVFIMLAGGPIVGPIYDRYGPRYILLAGTFLHVFGLMMVSLSSTYYQIMLAQGICSGIGISCLFSPATNCVSSWFYKRRAFALGIVASGSSLGGVVFPIMIHQLIDRVGFRWAMRIAAFLIFTMLVLGNCILRSRLPPSPQPALHPRLYVQPLRDRTYMLTVTASWLLYLGIFLPINYLQVQAKAAGMSPSLVNYVIPIMNAASLFGRILPGWLGDKVGTYNTQFVMCLFTSVIVLGLWLPAHGTPALLAFAALYGFGSGAFVTLLPAIIAQISDIKEIGLRIGLLYAVDSTAALVGNPIGGAIISHKGDPFENLKIFCGVIILIGCVVFGMARMNLSTWKVWRKV